MGKLDISGAVIRDLHPVCRPLFERLSKDLEQAWANEKTQTLFRAFEGHRSPIKQMELLNRRPPITHVGPWHSAHQYGFAVDFVPWKGDAWSWSDEHDYTFLRLCAEQIPGLHRPMNWDLCHIEYRGWDLLHTQLKKLEKAKWLPLSPGGDVA